MGFNNREEIFINLIHYPIYSLGLGTRIGIWFQGCTLRCKGCISPHTWEFEDRYKTTISKTIDQVKSYTKFCPHGITISGGEPFAQSDALYTLLIRIREVGFHDIMLYSGHSFEYLNNRYSHILKLIDVLVDSPFIQGLETDSFWKGSENQNMFILTNNNKQQKRYSDYINRKERKLQIVETDEDIHIIGIPRQTDSEVIKNGFS